MEGGAMLDVSRESSSSFTLQRAAS